jgi:hypothetical protein
MNNRSSGGENLYNASADAEHNECRLAVFAYLTGYDPEQADSLRADYIAVKIRQMWKYSSDIRGGSGPSYEANAIPRFLAKMNVKLTDGARGAYWNYKLAKAVDDGQ